MEECFDLKCYSILKKVPRGKVVTYKDIAIKLKSRGYRAVGNAMNRNPYSPGVPCHRVVKSDGGVGGFAKGTQKKIFLLRNEGIEVKYGKIDLNKYRFKFR